jgi:hypothetical protein
MSQSLKFLLSVRIIFGALLSMDDMAVKETGRIVFEGREDFQWSERNKLHIIWGFSHWREEGVYGKRL